MADSNHLSARADELADDDPFAELTRIMGQGSFMRPQPVDDMDALGLDLEKELLGDFSDDEVANADPAVESQADFNIADAFGEGDFASDLFKGTGLDDFEQALSDEPVFEEPESAPAEDLDQPYIPDEHYQVDAYEANDAADLGNELDAAFEQAASPHAPIFSDYREPEAPVYEPETASYEPDLPASDSPVYDETYDAEPQQYAASDAPFDLSGAVFSLRGNYAPAQDDYADAAEQPDQFAQDEFSVPLNETDLQLDHSQYAYDDNPTASDDAELAIENALQDLSPAEADADAFAASDLAIKDELERALGLTAGWDETAEEPSFAADESEAETPWQASTDEPEWADGQQAGNLAAAAAGAAAATAWTSDWNPSGSNDDWQQQVAEQEPAAEAYGNGYSQYDSDPYAQAEPAEPTADAAAYDGPPEIETVEIPEKVVAVTENLDIPHVPYREEVRSTAQLDDIEELLSGAFGGLDQPAPADEWVEEEQQQQSDPTQDDFDELLTAGLAAASAAALARNNYSPAEPQFDQGWNEAYEQAPRPMPGTPPPAAASGSFFNRRNKTIAALLAGVAILGIGSVYALNQFGDGGGEAVVIKADNSPIKEKPENPGGTTVPNQDSQVYRQVAGETPEPGSGQTQLVSSAEEPVELAAPADDVEEVLAQQDELLPQEVALSESMAAETAAKNEERLVSTGEEAGQSESFTMLTPRRVRSFVVRPDGTMVPREVEAPAAAEAAGSETLPGVNSDRIEVAAAAGGNASQDMGLVAGQEVPPLGAAPAGSEAAGSMPQSAPIPAPRPANVAPASVPAPAASVPSAPATAAPTQVAAAQPAAPAETAAASGWSVQIASQPTLEAAQQSYQSLAQRYGTMLQGKGVNIVKAEVQGKGTYYRVRIPASSKNDAISLCESLKTQGGSCFVSQ